MVERLPSGNPFSDGEVLEASDLNDTFAQLVENIENVSDEVVENRLSSVKLEFLNTTSTTEDSENLLVDIPTDSNGWQDNIVTSSTSYIQTGNKLQNFHYFNFDNDFQITQDNYNIGKSFLDGSYDPIRNEVFIVTDVSYSSGSITVDYEVYDESVTQVRSSSVTSTASGLSEAPATLEYVAHTSEGNYLVIASGSDSTPDAILLLIDTVGGSEKDSADSGEGASRIATVAGASGSFGAAAYSIPDTNGDIEILEETSSGFNITNLGYSGGSTYGGIAGLESVSDQAFIGILIGQTDDFGGEVQLLSAKDAAINSSSQVTVSDDNGNPPGVSLGLKNQYATVDVDVNPDQLALDLRDGTFDESNSLSGSGNLNEFDFRASGYNSNDGALRTSTGHIWFDAGTGYETTGGSNLGADPNNVFPNPLTDAYVHEADNSIYQTNVNSQTLEVYNLTTNNALVKDESFQWETQTATSDTAMSYVKFVVGSTNNPIENFKLVDTSDGSVVGTFSTGEKIDVTEYNLTQIKARLDADVLPTRSGVKEFSLMTW